MPRIQDAEFSIDIGDAIRARREWLELSQMELGRRVGISGAQMAKYELGQDSTSALVLVRIATALATTVNDLLGPQGTPSGSGAHLAELAEILADSDIAFVVRAMLTMSKTHRNHIAGIVDAYVNVPKD